MNHKVIPSVNIYIIKDDKVLLGRRINTGWMDGSLCPFGGHVEEGESPTVAIIREINEELGVNIDSLDLELLCVAARNTTPPKYVAYEFIIRNKDYSYINAEPNKCSELVWVDINNLPNDIIDDFDQIIKRCIIGDEKYVELGY